MIHQISHEHKTMIGFIELLNEMGLNVVHIDNSFFMFTSFQEVDDVINEIEIQGRNITSLIESETATAKTSHLRREELITRINEISTRRRQFHPNTPYTKYLSS